MYISPNYAKPLRGFVRAILSASGQRCRPQFAMRNWRQQAPPEFVEAGHRNAELHPAGKESCRLPKAEFDSMNARRRHRFAVSPSKGLELHDCRDLPDPWRGAGTSCRTQEARRIDRHAQVRSCLWHRVHADWRISVPWNRKFLALKLPNSGTDGTGDALRRHNEMPCPAQDVAPANPISSWNLRLSIPYSCHAQVRAHISGDSLRAGNVQVLRLENLGRTERKFI